VSERRDVLTVKEAAGVARVSPATIRRWCQLGHLTAFQVGRGAAIRIPAAELRALLQRLEDESG
jgi:excisionase family DNA binding protein